MEHCLESNAVMFKIEPNIIPATVIQKLDHAFGGQVSDIWKCSMSTQSETHLVALKSVRVPTGADGELIRKTGNRIRREAYVWIQLSHNHILPFEGVTEGFGPLPALVTPWMENGSLNNYLRQEVGLSREMKLSMAREVAAGLQYLHDKDIVHGNLTGTNILVSSEGRLYLGDFGLSIILTESESTTFDSCHPGNIRWLAPEVLVEEESDKPTKACDVYSYGCIMMQVFSGHQPYRHIKSIYAVMSAMSRGVEPFSQLTNIDEEIQRFARLCLSRNREYRPLVGKIVEFLWPQTNIAETMKTMLSKLPVTVKHISEAVLTKFDYHADDSDVLGAALKYKWVHESGETEVSAFLWIHGTVRYVIHQSTGRGRDFEGWR
ncbi:kinase-like domain-containing protein [Suillus americanus]|nr:kinase-like domain-containing protein [Suillus americanus]